jgi:lipopolysaccharide export system protein LptC
MSSRTEIAPDHADRLLRAAVRRARLAPLLSRIAAGIALGLVVLFAYQSGFFVTFLPKPVLAPVTVDKPEQITGQNSRIAGFDKQLQPYEITAERGVQDKANADLVHLEKVVGTFQRPGGGSNRIVSNTGLYDTKSKELDLEGDVKIIRDTRFTATMDRAHVNVETKDMVSDAPVLVELTSGTIRANGMKISNDGKTVVFLNGVKAQFDPGTEKGDEAQ